MTPARGRPKGPSRRPRYPNRRVALKVYMDIKDYEKLRAACDRVGVSMTEAVRRAIRVVLKLES